MEGAYKLLTTLAVIAAFVVLGYLAINFKESLLPSSTSDPRTFDTYTSEAGISFKYPDTYKLSSRTETLNGDSWDDLLLIPKDSKQAVNSENLPVISLSVFANTDSLPLDEWIKDDQRSNFRQSAGVMRASYIAGQWAQTYQYSGLYEEDAVVFLVNGKIYLLTSGWINTNDPIRKDFSALLDSVSFQ